MPPATGLAAMRIGVEFGGADGFADSFARALARGGPRGATMVARVESGAMSIHLPGVDAPCWNSVPLFGVRRGEAPSADDWAITSAVLEKLERSR
jgi:hypothetical protein